ncbi:ABC transporter substrate-binding protein [Ahrensia kielensis]|uniref:ABC transporter substrate-binding protein n=1 Tax=Ahrensia kielensis TaxID=76980 RepID=UPI00037AEB62|nr:ABC transporter substrate-binding protein [Ahrensia kielensis]
MGHKLSVLTLIVAQVALAPSSALAAPAGEFVIAVHQEPQDLAAQGAYKEINAPGLRNVLEPLIATDSKTGEYIPVLAASWGRVDDKTVRVTLREGVKFHDGTDMTAEAVATAVSFVWNPDSSFTIQEYASPGVMSAKATGPLDGVDFDRTGPDAGVSTYSHRHLLGQTDR